MSNASQFFSENIKSQLLLSINTCMPCKVLSYNEGSRRAKIQPLFKTKEVGREPSAQSVIEDVPVMFERVKINGGQPILVAIPGSEHTKITFEEEVENVPVLKKDDTVLVVFAQRSIEDALEGNIVYPGTSRLFSLQDAIIVGLL